MQNSNSNTAALLVLNQLHPEKTRALPSRTSATNVSSSQNGQPEIPIQPEQSNVQPREDPQVPEQSGHGNVQPEVDSISEGYDSPSDSAPDASPTDDFTEVYRTGNFGTHFGKVNVHRGKRWAIVHGVLASLMFVFSIAASIMLRNYTKPANQRMLLAFTWMAALTDWCTVFSAVFLMWRLSTLRHPLATLMALRTSAAFNFGLNLFFFLVGVLGLVMEKKDFIRMTSGEIESLKYIFVVITLLMAVKVVTSYAFVCLWWSLPTCYHALASKYCVYDKGETLAPGVDYSAGTANVIKMGQVAEVVGNVMIRV